MWVKKGLCEWKKMGYCIVDGCNSKSDVNQGIKLHILPQNDEERLRKWLEAIGKMGMKVAQHGRVCSRHFSINDYYKSRSGEWLIEFVLVFYLSFAVMFHVFLLGMIDCLKKEAIPSLNLPGDIDSRRLANTAVSYRWDESKKVSLFIIYKISWAIIWVSWVFYIYFFNFVSNWKRI